MEYVVAAVILLVVLVVGGRRPGGAPDAPPARAARRPAGRARPRWSARRPRTGRPAGPRRPGVELPPLVGRAAGGRGAGRSRRPSRPPAGWSGCGPGCPARRTSSARACSALLVPRPPRRGRLGGDRGQPDHRRRRRRAPPGRSSSGCASGPGCSAPAPRPSCARCSPRSWSRRSTRSWTASLRTAAARRPAGGAAGRRGQRRRQDHHLRQDRPGAGRRRPHGACSARPTPSGPPPPSSWPPGASRVGAETVRGPGGRRPGRGGVRRGQAGHRRPAWTPC